MELENGISCKEANHKFGVIDKEGLLQERDVGGIENMDQILNLIRFAKGKPVDLLLEVHLRRSNWV